MLETWSAHAGVVRSSPDRVISYLPPYPPARPGAGPLHLLCIKTAASKLRLDITLVSEVQNWRSDNIRLHLGEGVLELNSIKLEVRVVRKVQQLDLRFNGLRILKCMTAR